MGLVLISKWIEELFGDKEGLDMLVGAQRLQQSGGGRRKGVNGNEWWNGGSFLRRQRTTRDFEKNIRQEFPLRKWLAMNSDEHLKRFDWVKIICVSLSLQKVEDVQWSTEECYDKDKTIWTVIKEWKQNNVDSLLI